jgi:hypothetical protein
VQGPTGPDVFSATKPGFAGWTAQGETKIMTVHDMEKATATYGGFMATLKWAVPVIAIITFIVVSLIAS